MMTITFLMPHYADQQIYPDDDHSFSHALLCWSTDLSWWWPELFSFLTLLINRSILLMIFTLLLPNYTDQQIYPDDDHYIFSRLTMLINRSILMMTMTFLHVLLCWSIDLSWWWPLFSLPNSADQLIYPDKTRTFLLLNSADQQIYPDGDHYFSHALLCWSADLSGWWSVLFCTPYSADQQIYPDDDHYFSLPNSAGQQIYPDDDQNFSPS